MPNLAAWHPQIVHFIIALAFVGVGARVASLLPLGPRFRFAGGMATTLIVLAAIASVLGVKSGLDAHGPAERVPGAREIVIHHEETGKTARTALILLAVAEIAAFALADRPKLRKAMPAVAALGGLVTLALVYEAAEHGGEVVYSYAGNVGLRSGDSADVRRLLVAGLYHRALQERTAGRGADAARLVEELARQAPGDTVVRFLVIESLVHDRKDGRAALALLDTMTIPASSARFQNRKATLTADAYVAAGLPDSARAVLEALKARTPPGPAQDRIQQAIDRIGR